MGREGDRETRGDAAEEERAPGGRQEGKGGLFGFTAETLLEPLSVTSVEETLTSSSLSSEETLAKDLLDSK